MHTVALQITRELLNSGVFNHLPDGVIYRLQWMLMTGEAGKGFNLHQITRYWYKGDYYSQSSPQHLLHRCNHFLLSCGQPVIDVYSEEFFDS